MQPDIAATLPQTHAPNATADSGSAHAPAQRHSLYFTGNGQEYFRIWIVNLCLSLFTLGIYTAWAKTRRMQYFYRNTQLAGAAFDFHGDPKRIFFGRLIAVLLLVLYNYGFDISVNFGIGVVVALLLALPYFIRGSLRFRLRNCSYRGLRLDFDGNLRDAYFAYWPMLLLFFLPPVWAAIGFAEVWMAWFGLLYLFWPWMHGRMRAYQQQHLCYANLHSEYSLSPWRFFRPYLSGIFWGMLVVFSVAICIVLLSGSQDYLPLIKSRQLQVILGAIALVLLVYIGYLFSTPFVSAVIFNMSWQNTRFPPVIVHGEIPVLRYMLLIAKNTILTLLTLGLYRPFAVVAVWRFRLQHMALEMSPDIWRSEHASGALQSEATAGEAMADFLNLDLSW